MDKRLQNALNKAVQKKQTKQRQTSDTNQEAKKVHDKFIKKWLPKARAWIDKKLFKQIADAEASGIHYILLGRYEDGIHSEVIYEAAKKIKGLRAVRKQYPTYENAEPSGWSEPTYAIEWDSTDPNDHRNDR
jgi:hypothetical protein